MNQKRVSKLYSNDCRYYAHIFGKSGLGWYWRSHAIDEWVWSLSFEAGEYTESDLKLVANNFIIK